MQAYSKCFKQISRCEPKFSISAFLSSFKYSSCSNSNCQLYAMRKWKFNKNFNGYLLLYFPSLQMGRNYQLTNYVTSIPVAVSWIWPSLAILNKSIDNYQSIATQASPDEEIVDNVLNQILSSLNNAPHSSKEICSSYIDQLVRSRNLRTAARLLLILRDKRIYLSPNTYNLLLIAAGEGNDIDLLFQIFKDLLVSCESMTSTSYLNLAKGFMNTNDTMLLLRLVKEVSELSFLRSATVVNRIIFAFAETGQIEKAILIFDHVKSLKCKPDLVTYNMVLEILGRVGRVEEMLHEFASMKEANINPDIISYNTLLSNLWKVGRSDLCVVFQKEMGERGLEPDLRTYKALIESFGRSGNIEESLRLFDEMKRKRVRPSIYIYRSLIHNLKKIGKLDLAMNLSEEMITHLSHLVGPKDFKRKNK